MSVALNEKDRLIRGRKGADSEHDYAKQSQFAGCQTSAKPVLSGSYGYFGRNEPRKSKPNSKHVLSPFGYAQGKLCRMSQTPQNPDDGFVIPAQAGIQNSWGPGFSIKPALNKPNGCGMRGLKARSTEYDNAKQTQFAGCQTSAKPAISGPYGYPGRNGPRKNKAKQTQFEAAQKPGFGRAGCRSDRLSEIWR